MAKKETTIEKSHTPLCGKSAGLGTAKRDWPHLRRKKTPINAQKKGQEEPISHHARKPRRRKKENASRSFRLEKNDEESGY